MSIFKNCYFLRTLFMNMLMFCCGIIIILATPFLYILMKEQNRTEAQLGFWNVQLINVPFFARVKLIEILSES